MTMASLMRRLRTKPRLAKGPWLAPMLGLVALGLIVAPMRALATIPTYSSNYLWDADRRLTMVISPDPGTGVRPATQYIYDANGQVTQVDRGTTDAAGANFVPLERVVITYDAVGNKTMATVIDVPSAATLGLTQTAYDADDRTLCVAVRMNPATFASPPADACTLGPPAGTAQDRIIKTIYDPAGEVIQVLQGVGTSDQRTYETFCDNAVPTDYTTHCYTPNGKVQYEADANGNLTKLTYDGFDRLVMMNLPASTTPGLWAWNPNDYEAYTYDANGNRLSLRKRDSHIISWCYDALNREVEKYVSPNALVDCAASPPTRNGNDVATTYDLINRKVLVAYASGGAITYGYDNASRLKTETSAVGTLSYGYDPVGNRTQVTWPDSFYVTYAYDVLNHVTQITDSASVSLASYVYDGMGRRTNINRGNGANTTLVFDNDDRLTALRQNLTGTASDLNLSFNYNPASQVLSRGVDNATYTWSAVPIPFPNKTYDGLNRDASIVSSSGYDLNGNLINDGTRAFTYDVENRLTSVSAPTGITLTYDPLSRLQQATVGSNNTSFLYDGDRLAAEYNGTTLLRRYVHGTGTDEPLVWYEGSDTSAATGDRRWLHTDNQGSVIAWSDTTGAAGETYAYGPYGEPLNWSGSRFRYTGQIAIPEAQLYYYKARAYDPLTGRFLQTDPVGYKDDVDLYAYVGEDPVNRLDSTGLAKICGDSACDSYVWVDGDGDGDSHDDDLSKSQKATLGHDFASFIAGHSGKDLKNSTAGILFTGSADSEHMAFVRSVSQFIGSAAHEDTPEAEALWKSVDQIQADEPGLVFNGFSASVSGPIEGRPGRVGVEINGNFQEQNGNYYDSASNLARMIAHETIGHKAMTPAGAFYESLKWVHKAIDARARQFIKLHGLAGGGCVAASFDPC